MHEVALLLSFQRAVVRTEHHVAKGHHEKDCSDHSRQQEPKLGICRLKEKVGERDVLVDTADAVTVRDRDVDVATFAP